MAAPIDDNRRALVPRWRGFARTVALGELAPIARSHGQHDKTTESGKAFQVHKDIVAEQPPELLVRLQQDFNTNPTPAFAGDLLSTAISMGRLDLVRSTAESIAESSDFNSPVVEMARRILSEDGLQTDREDIGPIHVEVASSFYYDQIRRIKQRLRVYSGSAFDWMDLGLLYETIGQLSHAERSVRIALTLAPNNRHILRSSSQFWIHRGEPDRAHSLLAKSSILSRDPWLLAAEIAISGMMSKSSRHLKLAKRMISDDRFHPFHGSELAGAIATHELEYDNIKIAKKFFRASLRFPTENSVAQASWADRRFDQMFSWQADARHVTCSHEANAISQLLAGKWSDSLASTRRWLADQPFAAGPIVNASFLMSSAIDDLAGAVDVCAFGMKSNPKHMMIRNNLAFALIKLGRLSDAESILTSTKSDDGTLVERTSLLATWALLYYRRGLLDRGRLGYQLAVDIFRRHSMPDYARRAELFQSIEEIRLGNEDARRKADEIMNAASSDIGIKAVIDGLKAARALDSDRPDDPIAPTPLPR